MFTERTSVGLDVHARSISAAAIDCSTGEVFRDQLAPGEEYRAVLEWVRALPGAGAGGR